MISPRVLGILLYRIYHRVAVCKEDGSRQDRTRGGAREETSRVRSGRGVLLGGWGGKHGLHLREDGSIGRGGVVVGDLEKRLRGVGRYLARGGRQVGVGGGVGKGRWDVVEEGEMGSVEVAVDWDCSERWTIWVKLGGNSGGEISRASEEWKRVVGGDGGKGVSRSGRGGGNRGGKKTGSPWTNHERRSRSGEKIRSENRCS